MPVQPCESDSKPAYRWGDVGKAYSYDPAVDGSEAEAGLKAFLDGYRAGDTTSMNTVEAEAARELSKGRGLRLTKDASDNLIIAWYLNTCEEGARLATQLALPYGESPEDLHLTIFYLGDAAEYDLDLIAAVVKIFSVSYGWSKIEGTVTGIGRFVGDGDQDVVVALVDIPDLDCLRRCLRDELEWKGAIPYDSPFYQQTHGFLPHITLAYQPRTQSSPAPLTETLPICIEALTVKAGPAAVSFELLPTYSLDASDSTAYYAARGAVAKAGRVLSKKNMGLVAAAIDALTALEDAAKQDLLDPEFAEVAALRFADMEKAVGKPPKQKVPSRYNADGTVADAASATEADDSDHTKKGLAEGDELEYFVQKAQGDQRYTFGPLYAPERKDAHGEAVDAETLQKAVWGYVQQCVAEGNNRINLQHDDSGDATVGEWVEVCAWPYETTIKVALPGEAERELVMPAGTVYMGVIWDEKAWEEGIQKKRLTGYSLGGRAVRVANAMGDLPDMGDKLAAREAEIDLAVEVGKADAERKVYRTVTERLFEVLGKHADAGVTINENGSTVEALLAEE